MHLTLHTDYALRSLLYLGSHPDRIVPVSEISAAYGISSHHVAKVAKALVRLGLVKAQRGKLGGLRLAKPPDEINLGTVVRATEPNLDLLECFNNETNECPIEGTCALQSVLKDARAAFFKVIDAHTLGQLLHNRGALKQLLSLNLERVSASRVAQVA